MKDVVIYTQNNFELKVHDIDDSDLSKYTQNISEIFDSKKIITFSNNQNDKSILIRPSQIIAIEITSCQDDNNNIQIDTAQEDNKIQNDKSTEDDTTGEDIATDIIE